ncbi:protein trichome birefringence-like 34 isoform X1 [Amborella trichopoda]|nr:protein trichome birefringence-like 34 isoform X1 [Amborella trichopoda]|eukprot:XP_006828123.2 protein trichome birefringence-like 34 isoform X1 [Amborella trichopoda]
MRSPQIKRIAFAKKMALAKRFGHRSQQLSFGFWGVRQRFGLLFLFLISALLVAAFLTGKSRGPKEDVNFGVNSDSDKATVKEKRPGDQNHGQCDVFSGRWVFDNISYPIYSERNCSFMSDQLACAKWGRSDLKYQNWRWQPHRCSLPRFNATAMLERLRGKRMVFVGDSLNRGQWVSMVCLLDSGIEPNHKSMHSNGSLMVFTAKEYNATVEFYWAPLLVESNSDDPVNHRLPDRIVRVESMEKHAQHWSGAEFLIFNSYLWWRRPKMKVLWGSFGSSDAVYEEIEMIRVFRMTLETWAKWVVSHEDPLKTKFFFVGVSPTHFSSDEWGEKQGGNCYNETEPIRDERYWGEGSDKRMIDAMDQVIAGMREKGVSVSFLNITQLSEYRKDGHPSIYRKQWEPLKPEQLADPASYADCIHWCLPGVPDTWNELLYASLFSHQ